VRGESNEVAVTIPKRKGEFRAQKAERRGYRACVAQARGGRQCWIIQDTLWQVEEFTEELS
jgi:hypothetical protein